MSSENDNNNNASDNPEASARAAIDKSVRWPAVLFLTSAVVWLVVASLLGLLATFKLNVPEAFSDLAFLQYGRLQPAHMNAFLYGWGFNVGFAVAIWLTARLCRVTLDSPILIIILGHVWNFGVILGVGGILAGAGTGMEWLDFPKFIWPILFISYSLIAVCMVVMFSARKEGHVFVSQWYLLAALFWFPWLYLTSNLLIHLFPGAAVMSTAINGWYVNGLLLMWFVPLGLAAAYYLISKVVGRPVFSYQLALGAFWGYAFLAGWAGVQKYIGGPLPAWVPALSGVAAILLLIPVAGIALNHNRTVGKFHGLVQYSPTLRFTVFGGVAFTIMAILGAALALFDVAQITQFSSAYYGYQMLGLYGFFTMVMFGAIYYMVPRIMGCEWRSGKLIQFHFWFSTYGFAAMAICLIAGGFSQGSAINNYETDFMVTLKFASGYMKGVALAWVFILLSNIVFMYHVVLMVFRRGNPAGAPTMIHEVPAKYQPEGANV